jgi:hypothetical protein
MTKDAQVKVECVQKRKNSAGAFFLRGLRDTGLLAWVWDTTKGVGLDPALGRRGPGPCDRLL